MANTDVLQVPLKFQSNEQKWMWLLTNAEKLTTEGNLLIFVAHKTQTEELAQNLEKAGFAVASIHGDKSQKERQKIMFAFSNSNLKILIATDVIARGMDIKDVHNVVCYEAPRNLESHTHRIGRTGRAGKKGTAWSLLTEKDTVFASFLVRSLEGTNKEVPHWLLELALKDKKFAKTRQGSKMGGLGFTNKRKHEEENPISNFSNFVPSSAPHIPQVVPINPPPNFSVNAPAFVQNSERGGKMSFVKGKVDLHTVKEDQIHVLPLPKSSNPNPNKKSRWDQMSK